MSTNKDNKSSASTLPTPKEVNETVTCGLVIPISAIDGCGPDHWAEVKSIVTEAIESSNKPTFCVRLVSEADDVGIIQKRIIQNLHDNEIVICDVSCKNPNVMFELGLRLAFDKPTVIIKDDKTDYIFDTSVIEHLTYPRDLRFTKIVDFKKQLAAKVVASYRKSKEPGYSAFLKNFGTFTVASLEESVVSADKLILDLLSGLQSDVSFLKRRTFESESRNDAMASIAAAYRQRMASADQNGKVGLSGITNADLESWGSSPLVAEYVRALEAKNKFDNDTLAPWDIQAKIP